MNHLFRPNVLVRTLPFRRGSHSSLVTVTPKVKSCNAARVDYFGGGGAREWDSSEDCYIKNRQVLDDVSNAGGGVNVSDSAAALRDGPDVVPLEGVYDYVSIEKRAGEEFFKDVSLDVALRGRALGGRPREGAPSRKRYDTFPIGLFVHSAGSVAIKAGVGGGGTSVVAARGASSSSANDAQSEAVRRRSMAAPSPQESSVEQGLPAVVEDEPSPPAPPPKWSFHGRPLPDNLISLSSPYGRRIFKRSLFNSSNMNIYFPLTEQFLTQSEPAYCGLTSLCMSLNALNVDPLTFRWKGGWRWFTEDVFFTKCFLSRETVKQEGITMDEFVRLGRSHDLQVDIHRVDREKEEEGIEKFRQRILESVRGGEREREGGGGGAGDKENGDEAASADCGNCASDDHAEEDCTLTIEKARSSIMVVSFDRSCLGQTGEGHFSPVGGYDAEGDRVLVLDVARFKYPPYWVSVESLWEAMKPQDPSTGRSRGYFMMKRTDYDGLSSTSYTDSKIDASNIPAYEDINDRGCPVGEIVQEFGKAEPSPNSSSSNNNNITKKRRRTSSLK